MSSIPQFSTPMMKQYREIKSRYADSMLFFRMGDFYELFLEDAYVGSSILNITLTKKSGGKDGNIPMAGVPYHAADTYIAKLVKAGHKVAICEQLTPPNKKGLVVRDVVRVVTPGTLLDENSLEKKENNYIVSICANNSDLSLAVADLSTGYFATMEVSSEDSMKLLLDELSHLSPSECILPESLYNDSFFLKEINSIKGINIFPFINWNSYTKNPKQKLKKHFGVKTFESFGLDESQSYLAASTLLGYLKETQKGNVSHIKKIVSLGGVDSLVLDRSTMVNLELFATIRDQDTSGSFLSVIDQTVTPMGGRLLKQWVKKPLISKEEIEQRYDVVSAFLDEKSVRDSIRSHLKLIPDIERLLSRLSVDLGNARDLLSLKHALSSIASINELLCSGAFPSVEKNLARTKKALLYVEKCIEMSFLDEPPVSIREGRMIKSGVDRKLDALRLRIEKSKKWIVELERREREETKISTLKVRFNKVFGFYIEISKTHVDKVPTRYMRKQTLVNGERFITEELKHHEEIILTAEETVHALEYEIFLNILKDVLTYTKEIQDTSEVIAEIDCLAAFSYLSEIKRYKRPTLLYSGEIRIKDGRHPVVEDLLERNSFVANSVTLDNVSQSMYLITGPNMAGKSVFIRQVALIVLMAQIGCYVPASSAHLSIVDRIFVRSGASDVITSGLSTFMVEMVETAHILHNATSNSLIIMDEIGRGTSTYDGISLAWSVAEYLVKNFSPAPKTLFATHYHELQALEEDFPNQIKNFHMAVTQEKGEPVFLHSLLSGGASHSFGVSVAKLAGIPDIVLKRSEEILTDLEKRSDGDAISPHGEYIASQSIIEQLFVKELSDLDLANMTPIESMNKLSELKEKVGLLTKTTKSKLQVD